MRRESSRLGLVVKEAGAVKVGVSSWTATGF